VVGYKTRRIPCVSIISPGGAGNAVLYFAVANFVRNPRYGGASFSNITCRRLDSEHRWRGIGFRGGRGYSISSGNWDSYALYKNDGRFVTEHAILLTELSPGTQYYFGIGSTDTFGNQIISNEYNFTTLMDITTSLTEFISPPTVIDTTDTTATIEWSTNKASDSHVQFDIVSSVWNRYYLETSNADLDTHHVVTLTDLTADTEYFFRVGSAGSEDIGPTISNEFDFNTDQAPDEDEPTITAPPTIIFMFTTSTAIQPETTNNMFMALTSGEEDGPLSIALSWKTDEPSNGEVRYGRTSSTWDNYTHISVDDELLKNHTVILSGLFPDQRYYFRAGSTDALGNGPSSDPDEINNPFTEQDFIIVLPPDIEAPRILQNPEVTIVDNESAIIMWETDEHSNSMVWYGLADSDWDGFTDSREDSALVTTHSVTITGLQPTTRYYFFAGSTDVAGNGPGVGENNTNPSAVDSFWTTDIVDEATPIVSSIEMVHATDTTVLIEWLTDEPGNSMVQYDSSSQVWGDYSYSTNDSEMAISHTVTLTGLQPETTYFYRVASTDANGNGPISNSESSNLSEEHIIVTNAAPDEDAPQISNLNIVVDEIEKMVIVEWDTDEPGNSQVQYDISSHEWGGYTYIENNSEMTQDHSVLLTNLKMDVPYNIRVSSVDASGNNHEVSTNDQNPSSEYTFQLDSGVSGIDPSPIVPPTILPPEGEQTAECFIEGTEDDPFVKWQPLVLISALLVTIIGIIHKKK